MKSKTTEPYTDELRHAGHDLIFATDVHQMFTTGSRFRSERMDYQSPWFGTMEDLYNHLRERGKHIPPIWRSQHPPHSTRDDGSAA